MIIITMVFVTLSNYVLRDQNAINFLVTITNTSLWHQYSVTIAWDVQQRLLYIVWWYFRKLWIMASQFNQICFLCIYSCIRSLPQFQCDSAIVSWLCGQGYLKQYTCGNWMVKATLFLGRDRIPCGVEIGYQFESSQRQIKSDKRLPLSTSIMWWLCHSCPHSRRASDKPWPPYGSISKSRTLHQHKQNQDHIPIRSWQHWRTSYH